MRGGALSPEEFFHPDGSGTINLDDLYFRKRIEQCDQHFSDVFVYTQEELRDNLTGFLNDLSRFLGTPAITSQEIDQRKRNVGVRTNELVRLLRALNRVNGVLKRVPRMPTLYNPLFHRLKITPRNLCQHRFTNIGNTPFRLPEATEAFLRNAYADDWAYVNEHRQQRVD